MDKSVLRRLDVLQRIAEKSKPCKVVVTFTDGSSATTDSAGAIGLLQEFGPRGEIESFQTDNPVYSGWARLLTGLLHPAPDRRIEDFE